jgi:hypothetical protein
VSARLISFQSPGTLLPLLEKVNLAINAIQLVQASADLVSGGKSASAKAQTGVKSAVQIASSVETLAGTFVTMPAVT